jgi:hypothetical protein
MGLVGHPVMMGYKAKKEIPEKKEQLVHQEIMVFLA